MIGSGYRSNSATEFPELERLEMVYEFKGITSNIEVFLRKVGVFHFCVDVMSAVP